MSLQAKPRSETARALIESAKKHSACLWDTHIECECGWESPGVDVADPRTAFAEHLAAAIQAEWPSMSVLPCGCGGWAA